MYFKVFNLGVEEIKGVKVVCEDMDWFIRVVFYTNFESNVYDHMFCTKDVLKF